MTIQNTNWENQVLCGHTKSFFMDPLLAKGPKDKQRGIALLIVLLIIALVSSTVYFTTTTVLTASEIQATSSEQLQAKYLLRSVLNYARLLVAQAPRGADPPKNSWGAFSSGIELPADFIGVPNSDISIGLEISAANARLPVNALAARRISGNSGSQSERVFLRWRDVFARFFKNLGFDEDNESAISGKYKDRVFTSEEMVANLIDFVDADSKSYAAKDNFASGIESDLPKKTFPNSKIKNIRELEKIPGFTPARLRKIAPYVTEQKSDQININLASVEVLRALDPDLTEETAREIYDIARGEDAPLNRGTLNSLVKPLFPNAGDSLINPMANLEVQSQYIEIIAKVQIRQARYFLRAIIDKKSDRRNQGELPKIDSEEYFQ